MMMGRPPAVGTPESAPDTSEIVGEKSAYKSGWLDTLYDWPMGSCIWRVTRTAPVAATANATMEVWLQFVGTKNTTPVDHGPVAEVENSIVRATESFVDLGEGPKFVPIRVSRRTADVSWDDTQAPAAVHALRLAVVTGSTATRSSDGEVYENNA
jgi:hypothetical protein